MDVPASSRVSCLQLHAIIQLTSVTQDVYIARMQSEIFVAGTSEALYLNLALSYFGGSVLVLTISQLL